MQCPVCQWQNPAEQKLCIKCGLFLLQPQLRWERCSYGRRAGAFLLDIPLVIVTLGIGWLIWNLVVMTGGQNPGKQLLGVYIINERGEPIGFWHHVLLRAFIGQAVFGAFTGGLYNLLDLLWPLWDRHGQSLHDKVAGSYVVRRMEARVGAGAPSGVWQDA